MFPCGGGGCEQFWGDGVLVGPTASRLIMWPPFPSTVQRTLSFDAGGSTSALQRDSAQQRVDAASWWRLTAALLSWG